MPQTQLQTLINFQNWSITAEKLGSEPPWAVNSTGLRTFQLNESCILFLLRCMETFLHQKSANRDQKRAKCCDARSLLCEFDGEEEGNATSLRNQFYSIFWCVVFVLFLSKPRDWGEGIAERDGEGRKFAFYVSRFVSHHAFEYFASASTAVALKRKINLKSSPLPVKTACTLDDLVFGAAAETCFATQIRSLLPLDVSQLTIAHATR